MNAVREALATGRVSRVLLAKESRAHGVADLAEAVRAAGVRIDYAPQAKLNALAGTHEHQGVAAAMSPVAYVALDALLEACAGPCRLLVLDEVQHPKNVGMLIRTAYGAGVSGVLLSARGGALLDDAVLRASAGTVLHLPVVPCKNLPQVLRRLREAEFWVYALEGSGKTDVFAMNWPDRHALVVGNETHGIRPGVRKVCDAGVRIDLDNGLDSLNVAVAAGVALFQARTATARAGSTPPDYRR